MIYIEQTIRGLDVLLARLERSLLDLKFPSAHARNVFRSQVMVHDIHATRPGSSPGWQTKLEAWKTRPSPSQPRSSLRIWQSYLDCLKYLRYADFQIVDGSFSDAEHLHFVANVKFAGLGRTSVGLVHATGSVIVSFTREQEDAPWQISAWQTRSFTSTQRRELMFEEVLEQLVPTETAVTLRRSLHEEMATDFIMQNQMTEARSRSRPFSAFDVSSWMRHPGLSVVDYDNDGFDDLFVTRRTGKNVLLRNIGDGTFEDTIDQAGLTTDSKTSGFTNAALFADFDNDGDQDVFVGRSLHRSRYYRNEGGRYVYSPEAVSIPLPAHVVSISAVDYNRDGLLDVFLSRYMPTANGFDFDMTKLKKRDAIATLYQANRVRLKKDESREFARRTWDAQRELIRNAPGLPNVLLKNVGHGQFVPAPEGNALRGWRPTYQSTWADYDGDGDSDVYVANDFSPNRLFRNDDGEFKDVTASTGTADNGFGMGASWGDYNGDGKLDLYVTNMSSKAGRRITMTMGRFGDPFAPMARGNTLFQQIDGRFLRVSGTTSDKLPVELGGWGWGGQFVDVDSDGQLDIFAPSGYYTAPPSVRSPVDT